MVFIMSMTIIHVLDDGSDTDSGLEIATKEQRETWEMFLVGGGVRRERRSDVNADEGTSSGPGELGSHFNLSKHTNKANE